MTESPKTTSPRPTTGRFAWLWAVLGAVLLAVAVGLGVYFLMAGMHASAIDKAVAQRLAEQQAGAPRAEQQGPPPSRVKVAQARMQQARQRITVVGRLMEVHRSVIASEVEGRVVELLTPAGREVVGGETVIARIDSVWSDLAVEQAKADLVSAQATARQSKRELEHLQALAQRSASDPQAIDDAEAKAEADAANVLAKQAALHRAEETQKRVEVIAPFDGTVSAKLTEKGQWLDPGSSVVEIVSRGEIDAVIDVPEQYIAQVKVGTPVEVLVEALGQTIVGEVIAINPDGSNAARTFTVKVRVDDQGGALRVGMSVTARVSIREEAEYLVVPRDAVQFTANGAQVWLAVVTPDSAPGSTPQAMPMDVEVLFGEGGVFAVEPKPKQPGMTLAPGMEVVTQGAERLFPTAPVMPIPDEGAVVPAEQASVADPVGDGAGG